MRTGWIKSAGLASAFLLMAARVAMTAPGQGGSTQAVQMMAKDADPDWEAVTVKPGNPNDSVSHINILGRHVMVENEPLEAMLKFAYTVQRSQIAGEPEWMKTARWDVSGVPDSEGIPNLPQLQSMMRKLLAERFGLKLHRAQREMEVFALKVVKSGPKIEKSALDPNGGPSNNGGGSNGVENHRYVNASMPDLALMLMIYTDRQIVDQTGLQGRYDFQLRWTKDDAPTTDTTDAPPGLFTAMQEQLGLKLEPVKATADILMIDQVARPDAN